MTLIPRVRRGQNFIQGGFLTLSNFLKNCNFALSVTSRRWFSTKNQTSITSRRWISTSRHWLSLFWTLLCNVATLTLMSRRQLPPLFGTSRCWISTLRCWLYRLPGTSRRCDLTLLEHRDVCLNVAMLVSML